MADDAANEDAPSDTPAATPAAPSAPTTPGEAATEHELVRPESIPGAVSSEPSPLAEPVASGEREAGSVAPIEEEVAPPSEQQTRARGEAIRQAILERAARREPEVRGEASGGSRSPLRRKVSIALAFLAPSGVIALSIYFIVKAGAPREVPATAASSTQPLLEAGLPTAPGEAMPRDGLVPEEQPEAETPEPASTEPIAPGFEDEGNDEEPKPTKPAPPKHFATVQEAAAGSCSTETVDGLSRQIIEQARCIKPNDFALLPKRPNLAMAAHVYPYLEVSARDHLLKALDAHSSTTMTVNSCLRTVAQQYLVSRWAVSKTCGVQLATPPGESNHEIGTALDIEEAAKWRPALEAQDFRWLGASDRVHFDYRGNKAPQRTATDVLAFQKLWNRNHKDDAIIESGRYDSATEQRLKKAPPSGFPIGANCGKGARPR